MLGLVEDVEVGGPVEVAVAVRPDVVAFGDYFVELVLSLVLKLYLEQDTGIPIDRLVCGNRGGQEDSMHIGNTYRQRDAELF